MKDEQEKYFSPRMKERIDREYELADDRRRGTIGSPAKPKEGASPAVL